MNPKQLRQVLLTTAIITVSALGLVWCSLPALAGGPGAIRREVAKAAGGGGASGDIAVDSVKVGAPSPSLDTGDLAAGDDAYILWDESAEQLTVHAASPPGQLRFRVDAQNAITSFTNGTGGLTTVISPTTLNVASGSQIGWDALTTVNSSADVALARAAAGVLKVTDGSTGGGALRVGTAADAASVGDFSAGLTGAGRMFLDASTNRLELYATSTASWRFDAGSYAINGYNSFSNEYMRLQGSTGFISLGGGGQINFASGTIGSGNVGVGYGAAGVAKITNGSTGLGALAYRLEVSDRTSNATLSGTTGTGGYCYTNAGAAGTVTLTLPASANVGVVYPFARVASFALRIAPPAGEKILYPGGTLADAKYLQIDTDNVHVKLVRQTSGDWLLTETNSQSYATDFTEEP